MMNHIDTTFNCLDLSIFVRTSFFAWIVYLHLNKSYVLCLYHNSFQRWQNLNFHFDWIKSKIESKSKRNHLPICTKWRNDSIEAFKSQWNSKLAWKCQKTFSERKYFENHWLECKYVSLWFSLCRQCLFLQPKNGVATTKPKLIAFLCASKKELIAGIISRMPAVFRQ